MTMAVFFPSGCAGSISTSFLILMLHHRMSHTFNSQSSQVSEPSSGSLTEPENQTISEALVFQVVQVVQFWFQSVDMSLQLWTFRKHSSTMLMPCTRTTKIFSQVMTWPKILVVLVQVKLSQWTCMQSCDLLQSSLFLGGFSTNMTQKHWLPLCGIHWYLTSQKVCIKTLQLPQNHINLPEHQNCPSCCHDEQSSPQQVHINSKWSQNLQQKMTDCWKIVNEWYLFVACSF